MTSSAGESSVTGASLGHVGLGDGRPAFQAKRGQGSGRAHGAPRKSLGAEAPRGNDITPESLVVPATPC